MADKVKKIKIQAVGLKDIKRELDDINKSMKEATDPSEMAKLTAEADVLEKQLSDVNKGIKEMDESTSSAATSSQSLRKDLKDLENEMLRLYHTGQNNTEEFMKMHQAAADIRSSISNLNRETSLLGANDAPQQMVSGWNNVGTSLKNLDFVTAAKDASKLAALSKSITFKTAITSLKDLGKTFLSLGKALLTNPIFLLAAVITGIVVAVYKLLDSLGIIEMALDALMKPIRYIIDLFYSLTDAMGLTNEHATRAAEESAKAYEDSADRIKKSTDKTIQGLDHQIKMAQLNGESTVELERKKLVAMTETLEAEMDAAKAKLKAAQMRGDLDAAEMKALEDKVDGYELAYGKIKNTIVEFETKVSNDRKNALKAEQEEIEKSNATKAQKAKEWAEKQEAIRKEEAANRLMAKRLEEDLDLQLMEEGDAKLLKQNQLTYERLIEDTKSNEKLNAEEKARVIAQYEKIADAKAEEIRKKKKEKEKAAAVQAQEELSDILYNLKTSEEQKALDDLDKYYDDTLKKLRENLEKGLITKEQFAEAEILLEKEKANKIKEIKEKSEEDVEKLEETLAKLSNIILFAADNLDSSFGAALASGIQGISEFIALSEMEFETGIEEIAAYAAAAAGAISGILSAVQDANRKALDETLRDTEASTNEQLSLINSQIEAGVLSVEAGEEAKNELNKKSEAVMLAARKKAFEDDKKFQIAQATVAGVQGALQAFTGAMQLGPIAGPIVGGVLAAAVAGMTAVNISKIKATKFNSGGGGGGGSVPTSATPSTPTRQAPIANFQGTGGDRNEVGAGSQSITIENNVSVSETEITDKQKTVHNLTQQSQL